MSTDNSFIHGRGKPPLALIAGPTASGKSDLAVDVALSLQADGKRTVVINADSAQVYADLAVLSARPAQADMRGIEHRLFGAWDGAQACSAADWAKRAKAEIAACQAEDAIPIVVGGTGLYLRTLLDGIAPVPEIDPAVRAEVRAMSVADAHATLQREDAERAALLSAADTTRVARALEVVRSTGRTLAEWQERREGGIGEEVSLTAAVLLPERETLYARCDHRFSHMLANGAIEEVRALLARYLDPALPVMRAIGVPEIAAYLKGEATLQQAEQRAAQATRHYVKRQMTWFRRQPPADWLKLSPESSEKSPQDEILFHILQLT